LHGALANNDRDSYLVFLDFLLKRFNQALSKLASNDDVAGGVYAVTIDLDELLIKAIMGSREDFIVFMDKLEETDISLRDKIANSKYIKEKLTLLGKNFPHIIVVAGNGWFKFNKAPLLGKIWELDLSNNKIYANYHDYDIDYEPHGNVSITFNKQLPNIDNEFITSIFEDSNGEVYNVSIADPSDDDSDEATYSEDLIDNQYVKSLSNSIIETLEDDWVKIKKLFA